METELNVVFGNFEVGNVERRNHYIQCQMKVSLIFDLSLSLLQENYTTVIASFWNVFYESEQHLNEAMCEYA